jgi:hypothetical protein
MEDGTIKELWGLPFGILDDVVTVPQKLRNRFGMSLFPDVKANALIFFDKFPFHSSAFQFRKYLM